VRLEGIDICQAEAWITHAEQLLDLLDSLEPSAAAAFSVPEDVLETFRRCLGEWREGLRPAESALEWTTTPDADELRRLMTYWLNLAVRSNEAPEAERSRGTGFYLTMVDALLGLLAADPCTAEFAEIARSRWPGLGAVCAK
jgi:hypothetical protein